MLVLGRKEVRCEYGNYRYGMWYTYIAQSVSQAYENTVSPYSLFTSFGLLLLGVSLPRQFLCLLIDQVSKTGWDCCCCYLVWSGLVWRQQGLGMLLLMLLASKCEGHIVEDELGEV